MNRLSSLVTIQDAAPSSPRCPLDGRRQFHSVRVVRLCVRDRRDIGLRIAILVGRSDNDGARTDLAAFHSPAEILVVPKISVGNDEAGRRFRQSHGLFVEAVAMFGGDLGGFDQ